MAVNIGKETKTPDDRHLRLEEICHQHGLRITRQRIGLGRLLFTGENRHVSAEYLYKIAQQAGLSLAKATVYNTLNQWADLGLLRRVALDGGAVYFDTNISNHHHFYDEETGRLIDVEADKVKLATLPSPPEGMQVSRVDVVIRVKS